MMVKMTNNNKAGMIPPRGFSTVEVLIALVITSLIGLGMMGMFTATVKGASTGDGLRDIMVTRKVVNHRIADAIENSVQVLSANADYLVLWNQDTDRNGIPQPSEIQVIEYDSENQTLQTWYADFPTSLSSESIGLLNGNLHIEVTDFESVTQGYQDTDWFKQEVWAEGVQSFSFTTDNVLASDVKLTSWQMTIVHGSMTEPVIGAGRVNPHLNAVADEQQDGQVIAEVMDESEPITVQNETSSSRSSRCRYRRRACHRRCNWWR